MTVALKMSLATDPRRVKQARRTAEQERAAVKRVVADAKVLVAEYPHTGPLRRAAPTVHRYAPMWAVGKIGLPRCRVLAAGNLSGYLFAQAVSKKA